MSTGFEPRTITISGTTYSAAHLDQLPITPIDKKSVGGLGGVRYRYRIEDSTTYWTLVDHLAVAACDVADEYDDSDYRVLAIYRDMEKI